MLAAWVKGMLFSSQVVKPLAEIVTEYVAGCTATKLKNPLLFDTVSRVTLVASLVRTILAWGITAPVESVTIPLNEPVEFCPISAELNRKETARNSPQRWVERPG